MIRDILLQIIDCHVDIKKNLPGKIWRDAEVEENERLE